jgi:hypothetical protein
VVVIRNDCFEAAADYAPKAEGFGLREWALSGKSFRHELRA